MQAPPDILTMRTEDRASSLRPPHFKSSVQREGGMRDICVTRSLAMKPSSCSGSKTRLIMNVAPAHRVCIAAVKPPMWNMGA